MRWLWLPSLLALVACTDSDSRWSILVDCAPSETIDAAARLAELELDEDGLLTAADLDEPGAVVVLTWMGPDGPLGTSVHASDEATVRYRAGATWDPVWGVGFPLAACDPYASVGMSFFGEDRNPTWLQAGLGDLYEIGLTPWDYEMTSAWEGEAQVRVTDVQADTASGHLEGQVQVDLLSLMPPQEPTGQSVRVEAFAFRDAPVQTNLPDELR